MKYKNMSVGWNNDSVSMTRVCSKCEHEVRDDDLYCSHCGKKFKQLAKFVSKEHILKIIDGKTMNPPKKEILTIVGDINPGWIQFPRRRGMMLRLCRPASTVA